MKVVLQDGLKDCGVCCLLSIIKHYGGSVSKEYLRELTNTTKKGVSAYKLVESAELLGLSAYGVKADINSIPLSTLPCIAHIIVNKSYQHFVVIYEIYYEKKKILIMDPAKGRKIISFSEFALLTSNYFIILTPRKKLPVITKRKELKKLLTSFIKNKKIHLLYLTILIFVNLIFNFITMHHFKLLLEYVININLSKNILFFSFIYLLIYAFRECATYLRNIIFIKWNALFDEEITMHIYKQILLLPYLYYKNRTSGEVISRMKDVSEIKTFLSEIFSAFTTDFICVLIFIIIFYKFNKILALMSIAFFLIMFVVFFLFSKIIKKRTDRYYKHKEQIDSYLIETLSSSEVLKGLHLEFDVFLKFKNKYQLFLDNAYKLTLYYENFSLVKNILIDLFLVLFFGFGSYFVVEDKITLGSFLVFQSILTYYIPMIQNIINVVLNYQKFYLLLSRIEDLFMIKKEEFQGGEYYRYLSLDGDIKFSSLRYGYGTKLLFNGLNLVIKSRDKIFLTGATGSGKSTLVKMFSRYIEIPFGMLSINGIDINHYHLEVLRGKITYVSQVEYLFCDTVYNNITMNREIDEELFDEVCKITKVCEIVESDELKYKRLVEENGINFSGGERQRIILARALLKKSDIYIFDEALNQVDMKKEKEIFENVFKFLNDKTIIVISHRNINKKIFTRKITLKDGVCYEEKL